MQRYFNTVRELVQSFKSFLTDHIPHGKKTRVDALSKLALTSFDHLTKKALVEILFERSIDNKHVNVITSTLYWTIPFVDYLLHWILPNDPTEARRINIKAP